jgi:serine/threonine protein kinase
MDVLCRGKHENLIEIYDHGVLQPPHQFYFIDMELCDTNLEEYIKGEKRDICGLLEWSTAIEKGHAPFLICAIMQQLLSGLKFIHDHNQVHRDLNPKNGM